MRRLLSAILLLAAAACADNAVLEVTLDLPPSEPNRNFAYVQARTADGATFAQQWSDASSLEGFRLRTAEREQVTLSVEARGDQVERALLLRIRFCDSSRCQSAADQAQLPAEQHLELERAFYFGEVTRFAYEVIAVPPPCDPAAGACAHPVEVVDKCRVFGCIAGSSSSGCTGGDGGEGRHFCE